MTYLCSLAPHAERGTPLRACMAMAADLRTALLDMQVKWGLTAGGPYPFTAGGYATAYVQVPPTLFVTPVMP